MTKTIVLYVEGQTSIVDIVKNETGLSSMFGRDLNNARKEYPGAEIVPMDYALERINEKLKEIYPMLQPKEITEEQFYEMFECLPPMQLKKDKAGWSFKMSEMTCGDITQGYVCKGDKYYSMNCRIKTKHEEMLAVIN